MKFETTQIHFLSDVYLFATMATWRNDFSSLCWLTYCAEATLYWKNVFKIKTAPTKDKNSEMRIFLGSYMPPLKCVS